MTILQAMERTDWSLRIVAVSFIESGCLALLAAGLPVPPAEPCEICDNERCFGDYVVVAGDGESFSVVVGSRCARDIRSSL